ncbi:MAG: DEAD/DEAH box helicase, partial [Bacteroidia bacterium]
RAVTENGYTQPTPIQAQAIPAVLKGGDLLAGAQTGTGKTAGFTLPMLERLLSGQRAAPRQVRALVLTPTRELAAQVEESVRTYGKYVKLSSAVIFGGVNINPQIQRLERGVDILVATPGRLLDLLQQGAVDLKKVEILVLDEADRMLDMGFIDDIKNIASKLPSTRQTILFSATMPLKIRQLIGQISKSPQLINIAVSKPAEGVKQLAFNVYEAQKPDVLTLHLKQYTSDTILIFCSTKEAVKRLERELLKQQFTVQAFHSDLEQLERERVMRAFKSKQLQILIGTDILSRGIDVEDIGLVINYTVPPDPEDYIHRIGRTARAAKQGTAITYIAPHEQRTFFKTEQLMGMEVEKPNLPATFGETPKYEPEVKHQKGTVKTNSFKKPFRKPFKKH